MTKRHRIATGLFISLIALMTAITGTVSPMADARQATPTTQSATLDAETPVGQQLTWLLSSMNGDPSAMTPDLLTDHFAPIFLQQVPAVQLLPILQQTAQAFAPLEVTEVISQPSETEAVVTVSGNGGQALIVQIAVDPQPPHQIVGLFFQPAPSSANKPATELSWSDFDESWNKAAPQASFLAAEVTAEGCVPIHAINPDQPLAIGSTFKLFVLGALGLSVQNGNVTWDQQVAINDDWKSLPSGTFQLVPAGTNFSLQTYAQQMISASDNTATDHLIKILGTEQIAAAQTQLGSDHASLNSPFPTTQQVFKLKLSAPDEVVAQFIAANAQERTAILTDQIDQLLLDPNSAAGWHDPKLIDQIEWFASVNDLCATMATLHELGEQPGLEPIKEALSINPGLQFDNETWTAIQFKGGSEPGVLNLTWLLQRNDGRWFIITGTLNDPENSIIETGPLGFIQTAIDIVAATP